MKHERKTALKARVRGPRPMVVPRPSQPLMMTPPLPTSAGASPADVTTGSGTFTRSPSYAHVVASAATRNLRTPAMKQDLLLSMP